MTKTPDTECVGSKSYVATKACAKDADRTATCPDCGKTVATQSPLFGNGRRFKFHTK